MPRRNCKFRYCKTNEQSSLRMYRFPSDEKRCKEWLEVVNNPVLNEMPVEKLRSYVICELHFEDWCFINKLTKYQLAKNAVPTIKKAVVCIKDLSASIRNAKTNSDQKCQADEILDAPAGVSETFLDCCVKDNSVNDVSIANMTSTSKSNSSVSNQNTAVVSSSQNGSTVQLNIPHLSEAKESNTQMKTHLCVSKHSTPKKTVKRHCLVTGTYSKENDSSKHSKEGESTPCNDTVATFNIAIIKEDFPNEELTNGDLVTIQAIILDRIDSVSSEGLKPHLKTFNLNDGVLVYTCLDKASCLWLKETLEGKIIGCGSPLQVIDPKKIPHPFKLAFNTKDIITSDPSKLLRRLHFFNSSFQVRCWKVLDREKKEFGQQLILQVDRPSFTAIEEANFKAFTGVDEGIFTVLPNPESNDLNSQSSFTP